MSEWWNSLVGLQQFFYGIGIMFSAVLVIQTVMLMFGMDHGLSHGVDIPHGDGGGGADCAGIHVLSVRTIIAFFVGFGWGGAAAVAHGAGTAVALLLATASGALFMYGVFWLMRALFAMRYSGTLNYDTITGQVGSVYVAIPPAQTGNGQIEIMIQGRVQMLSACTKVDEKIPTHAKVRVVGTFDAQTLLVEPANAGTGTEVLNP